MGLGSGDGLRFWIDPFVVRKAGGSEGRVKELNSRSFSLPFVSPGVRKKEVGIRGREWICEMIHGRIEGRLRCDSHIPPSLPLVKLVSDG